MDLFGIDGASLTTGPSSASRIATVADASHAVADGLPPSFTLLDFSSESNTDG